MLHFVGFILQIVQTAVAEKQTFILSLKKTSFFDNFTVHRCNNIVWKKALKSKKLLILLYQKFNQFS